MNDLTEGRVYRSNPEMHATGYESEFSLSLSLSLTKEKKTGPLKFI